MESTIVPYLFMATFMLALAFGLWQYFKVRKGRREHHHSAQAEALHEARPAPDACPR
jgi:ABC-type nickel/cobalt efflux system permease component RcnA